MQKTIDNLTQHSTVFVIAHRLSTIQNADTMVVLNSGEIVETGIPEELIPPPDDAYHALYNAQFKKK